MRDDDIEKMRNTLGLPLCINLKKKLHEVMSPLAEFQMWEICQKLLEMGKENYLERFRVPLQHLLMKYSRFLKRRMKSALLLDAVMPAVIVMILQMCNYTL